MGLRTPLSRVRGLGSAKQGAHHWILQRATAIALVPLTLFFLATMVSMAGMPYEIARTFMSQPLITFCFALLIVAGLWHAKIGLGEVVTDYIQTEGARVFLLLLINFLAYGLAAASLLAILRLYVTG
jgi:succinate dehydrogenase / fumarate reductase membrane anchor subunit